MPTISLCMIVKNEQEVLDNCLASVKDACDEIIIVDTGSSDKTKEIARKYTDKVMDFEWVDDFSLARNYSFSQATKDFILWLDADDILKEDDLKKLLELKKNLSHSIDVVSMIYNISFDEFGNPIFHFRRNRLVNRHRSFKWHGVVHEYLEVSGNIIASDIAITHTKHLKKNNSNGNRNLKLYEKQLEKKIPFSPRDLFYFSNELRENKQYEKAIHYYKEFLNTKEGWVEDNIRACLYLANCYKALGEKEEEQKSLFYSFAFDQPRPEICCRLGDYFIGEENYAVAVYWYKQAVDAPVKDNGAFIEPLYSTWYPHLQLCVCYWKLGQFEASLKHNKLAGKYKLNDPSVQYNNEFFSKYFAKKK